MKAYLSPFEQAKAHRMSNQRAAKADNPPSPLEILLSALTPPPNNMPLVIQHDRHRNKQTRQARQQRRSPANTQVLKHRRQKQLEDGRGGATEELIAGEGGRAVLGIGVGDVVQDGVVEQQVCRAEKAGADDGHNPVDVCSGGPSEDEERDGHEERPYDGGWQAFLRLELAASVKLRS